MTTTLTHLEEDQRLMKLKPRLHLNHYLTLMSKDLEVLALREALWQIFQVQLKLMEQGELISAWEQLHLLEMLVSVLPQVMPLVDLWRE